MRRQPRVALFYISRDGNPLDANRYLERVFKPNGFGLVWPPEGPLRWRDFWPRASVALEPALNGEAGEFERTLTRQFLSYWQSLRGMWVGEDPSSDWRELLAHDDGQRAPFEPLWDRLCRIATQQLGWARTGGYLGAEVYFGVSEGPIDQVTVNAEFGRDEIPADSQGLCDEVLQLRIRVKDKGAVPLPSPATKTAFERWRGVTGLGKSRGNDFIRLYIGVADWKDALTHEQRQQAIAAAFVAGLRMFRDATGCEINGVECL